MLKPLATMLRPEKLSDVIGQTHLVNKENGIINRIVEKKFIPSIIFYGLPGTGKTSLAQVIALDLKVAFGIFNAAIDKKQVLEKLINDAEKTKNYLLIIEEIHRMNRDRQDLLLQYLEQGTFTLLACTSENPYFVVNPALRSRCLLLELKPISDEEMYLGLQNILEDKTKFEFKISDIALKTLCQIASGDLRVAINMLELSVSLYSDQEITADLIKQIMPKANLWNFKEGDEIHDLKSALQKSIRGSDPNAAIYYLARLLASGDYEALLRRLLIIAYEDIGLANPAICLRLEGAISAFRQIGMPEGLHVLGLIIIEMALSEKSNSASQAIQKAYQDVTTGKIYPVPEIFKPHKKDIYKYPPNFKNSYVEQQYLPDKLKDEKYYQPKDSSTYERKLNELYKKFTNKN